MATIPGGAPRAGDDQQTFDPVEHLSLYKFKVVTEIKDEIIGWARVRLGLLASLLGFVILTGSFVGIRLLVESHIDRIAKAPVEDQIKVLQVAGQQAKDRVESLRLQSEQVTNMSVQTQHELSRLKGEADILRRFVKETETAIQSYDRQAKEIKVEADRLKEGNSLSTQYFQEQALRTKADMLQMRNNVDLLHSGFAIIEKLAAEIRQKDPTSELARQFAGFGGQWREARAAYERRAGIIKSRREIKIIHYMREDAPQPRHLLSQKFVDALLAEGYTAEGWATKPGLTEIEAAVDVARQFGADPKSLLKPIVLISPGSTLNIEDLQDIARKSGVSLPEVQRATLTPKSELLAGGVNGTFPASSIVLIAEIADAG